MGVPISNVTRRVVYAASGTGPYAFTFEILANTDIAVYKDDALLTLTTDYTVSIAGNGTGSITLTASPTGATQIAIVGNRTIQRTTDFVTGGDFFANTVNDEMDQQTIFAQQNAEGLQRALSAPQTDPTTINMTLPRAALRANKALGFDANGNPAIADTLGTNRGNWASGTLYYVRDIIKDTTNSNIWQCIVQHTSSGSQPIGTNADAAKWLLLVDAAAAATSATNAAASASAASSSASAASTSASNASSSASTASTQASNASTSATNAASSASAASSSASTASTAATNAGNSATAAATSATNASNSASAASTSASNASSSASAASTSASNASTSATNAANSATAASGSASTASTQATNAASSATAAAASESAAASSATSAAASYDAFDDRYLGAKSSNPSVDNDGNALITGAIYFNSVASTMRVYNGSAWQDQAASPDTIAERSFSATAGQTSYTFTGGYRVGYTYVYVNGALLAAADITATDGTTITFTNALSLNDEVRILSYKAIGSVAIGDISGLQTELDAKQATLVSGTNIKTIGGESILGSGNLLIASGNRTFTASGAIASAGLPVTLNSNGTVSSVVNVSAAGTEALVDSSAAIGGGCMAFYTGSAVVLVYKDNNNNNGYAKVGTLSGTTITWGSRVSFTGGYHNGMSGCWNSTSNKLVLFYTDISSNIYCTVGTITGTSISFSNVGAIVGSGGGGYYSSATYDPVSDKIVFVWCNTSSGYLRGKIGLGNGASWGAQTDIVSATTQGCQVICGTYGGSTNFMVSWLNASSYPNARAFTINAGSLGFGSFGSATSIASDTVNYINQVYNPAVDRFVAFYNNSSNVVKYQMFSVSTYNLTTIGSYTNGVVDGTNGSNSPAVYDSDRSQLILGYRAGTNGYIYNVTIAMTATALTFGSATQVSGTNSYGYENNGLCYYASESKVVGGFAYGTTALPLYSSVYTVPYSTNASWIGVSESSAANGASVSCTILGGVNTGVSGLTTGSNYYVATSGALTTASNAYRIGKALSATALLVTGNA